MLCKYKYKPNIEINVSATFDTVYGQIFIYETDEDNFCQDTMAEFDLADVLREAIGMPYINFLEEAEKSDYALDKLIESRDLLNTLIDRIQSLPDTWEEQQNAIKQSRLQSHRKGE